VGSRNGGSGIKGVLERCEHGGGDGGSVRGKQKFAK
jgi:hypothetical protein